MGLVLDEMMTPDLLEKSYLKHPVWKPWAKRSIDNLMSTFDNCVACKTGKVDVVGRGKPIRPWCFCGTCSNVYELSRAQIDMIHEYLWDADAGFFYLDKGIETIAGVMGLFVDGEVGDWIGENPDFVTSWSKEQEYYLHEKFGLTEIKLS